MSQELERYYLSIISQVEKLRAEKSYEKAIALIEEELQASYIPIEFDGKLTELLAEITFELNDSKASNKFLEMNENELVEKIFNNETSAVYAVMILFERFKEKIDETIINQFKVILKSQKYANNLKIVILEQLKINNFNDQYEFYSPAWDKSFNINLEQQKFINEDKVFAKAFESVTDLYYDEPMTSELANNLIFSTYNYFFPDFSKVKNEENLIMAVAQAIEVILLGKEYEELNKLTKVILSVMKDERGEE